MRILSLAAVALLAGCPDRTIDKLDPAQNGALLKDIPSSADIDVLFVIDNSSSTKDKQTAFAANLGNFVTALSSFPLPTGGTGLPNVHIGVVSTSIDIGDPTVCPAANGSNNGVLLNTPSPADPGCSPPTDRYISSVVDATGARQNNFPGQLSDALACIAQLGDTGCGFESPLEAMRRALDGKTNPGNGGFLRPNAYLAVIILTDEDDASSLDPNIYKMAGTGSGSGDFVLQPLNAYTCKPAISPTMGGTYTDCTPASNAHIVDVAEYVSFLNQLKDPAQIVVSVIAGPPQIPAGSELPTIMTGPLTQTVDGVTSTQGLALLPSCSFALGGGTAIARPAIRLTAFESAFGAHGLFQTVCIADYSATLKTIGELLFNAVSPCLEGSLSTADTSTSNAGVQLDCTVNDVVPGVGPDAGDISTQVPACAMTDATTPDPNGIRPCWWAAPDPATCATTSTHFEIHFERTAPVAAGTTTRVQCATGAADAGT